MSSVLEKAFAIIELLVDHPEGLPISAIATGTEQPLSGAHRTLQGLIRLGYVRQIADGGDYTLSIKLPAQGLSFLAHAGITDIAQPILDRLAQESGELIRLSVIEGDKLRWVAVAQGATRGLRYDPGQEQGVVVHLASTAGGRALLSAMSDERAIEFVGAQGFARQGGTEISVTELLAQLAQARARGYAVAVDSYIPGMAAMAVPILFRDKGPVLGCLSIAGPAVRMTDARMADLAPALRAAAGEIGEASAGSRYFAAVNRADA